MAPRANWKGYLKLSLVSCAVALYPASSTSSRVAFNTLNRQTGHRVKRQFIDAETGAVVEPEDQVKGYPVGKTQYIMVDDDELDAIRIESTHTIEIERFVPLAEVDHRYFDAPYYIAPQDRVSEEAFAVIREAMRDKKMVGVGRVVIARRERPMVIEPLGKGLLATTLRYANEVRNEADYFEDISDIEIPAEMKDLAEVIIDRKAGHFDPKAFDDRYEIAVLDILRQKEAGRPVEESPQAPRQGNVINIMDALRRSIEAEKAAPATAAASKPKAPSKSRAAKPAAAATAARAATAAPAAKKAGSGGSRGRR
jgi:DNA end-binding protein Ku